MQGKAAASTAGLLHFGFAGARVGADCNFGQSVLF